VPLVFDSGRKQGGKVWDIATGKELADFGPAFKEMHFSAAAWTPDGKTLLLGRGGECDGTSGIVHLVDPDNGKKTGELPKPGHLNGMTDMRWHPDGKRLATVGRDTVIMLWDVAGKKKVAELGKGRAVSSRTGCTRSRSAPTASCSRPATWPARCRYGRCSGSAEPLGDVVGQEARHHRAVVVAPVSMPDHPAVPRHLMSLA